MSSVEQQLADIKARKHQAEIEKARVEAQVEAARDQVKKATELLVEMGFSTVDEAKDRIKALRASIDKKLEEIRQSL